MSSGLSDEDAARLPQKKVLADTSEKPLRISESAEFLVESVMPGMRYRVFDLNGVNLYDGTWQGTFKAQGKPVIVRFENGLTAIFR